MKGQAATEYLLILAIVLVIVLASLAFFTNVPSLVSQLTNSGDKDFWANADLGVRSSSLYDTGRFVMNVQNNKAAEVTINHVLLNSKEYPVHYTIAPGQKQVVQINIENQFEKGNHYSFDLGFEYSMLNQNFEFKPGIAISGSVQ